MKKLLSLIILVSVLVSCSKDDATNDNGTIGNIKIANQKPTGSSANDLLSDDKFTSMVIELVYVEGNQPTQTAINNFKSFVDDRTFKPGGITIETRSIPSPGITSYSTQDFVDFENANRTKYNTEDQIAVWAYFADGKASGDTQTQVTLGTAYRNTSFIIYEATIKSLSGGFNQPSTSVLESTVIEHEFGHILGLVNFGTALQSAHEDSENPRHCNVEDCLMYYLATTGSNLMNLGGTIPQLDPQCIADLRANGGK